MADGARDDFGGMAGLLYVVAQPGKIELFDDNAIRLIAIVAVVSVVGGLTAETVLRKLLRHLRRAHPGYCRAGRGRSQQAVGSANTIGIAAPRPDRPPPAESAVPIENLIRRPTCLDRGAPSQDSNRLGSDELPATIW